MSQMKVKTCGHYETTYGHEHGYNERQKRAQQQHFDREWQQQYPSAEVIRRQSVAAGGYDKLGMSHLYDRSSQIRSALNDENGLLGPHLTNSYKAQAAKSGQNLYRVEQDDRGANMVDYHESTAMGTRANVGMTPAQPTRAERVQLNAKWSSRHTHEKASTSRVTNYDTEYIDKYNNVDSMEKKGWYRDNTKNGYVYDSQSFEATSKSKGDATTRPWTARRVTNESVWEMHPTQAFVQNTYPERPANPNDFDMRKHIPQYNQARTRPISAGNTGIRNIGPYGSARANNFWNAPVDKNEQFGSSYLTRTPTLDKKL